MKSAGDRPWPDRRRAAAGARTGRARPRSSCRRGVGRGGSGRKRGRVPGALALAATRSLTVGPASRPIAAAPVTPPSSSSAAADGRCPAASASAPPKATLPAASSASATAVDRTNSRGAFAVDRAIEGRTDQQQDRDPEHREHDRPDLPPPRAPRADRFRPARSTLPPAARRQGRAGETHSRAECPRPPRIVFAASPDRTASGARSRSARSPPRRAPGRARARPPPNRGDARPGRQSAGRAPGAARAATE